MGKESCSRVPMGDDEPMPAGGGKDPGPVGDDCERDDKTYQYYLKRSDRVPSWGGSPTPEISLKLSISAFGREPSVGPKLNPE